jgi:hypothetical protein
MPETKPRELFHRAHYNALAKEIRELFPIDEHILDSELYETRTRLIHYRTCLTELALSLCKRFKEDNPRFDPIKFLEACSPDNDLYPLAELYEGDQLG